MKRVQTVCISTALIGGLLAGAQAFGWKSSNGLAVNGLAPNGITNNGLQLNGLALHALRDLSDDPDVSTWMVDQNHKEVLRALVECALPSGGELKLSSPAGVIKLFGSLGLAPEWKNGPMTESGQRWVSACLMARVNAKGAHVPISLRGSHKGLVATAREVENYRAQEGAFYGNLFADRPYAMSCIGDSGQKSSDAPKRVCAAGVQGTATVCGFVSAGECQSSCRAEIHDYGLTFSNCQLPGAAGEVAEEVITVFLNTEMEQHP